MVGGDAAVARQREPCGRDEIAARIVGEEGFRAVVGPFHRTADALGRPQDRGLLGIEIVAKPEAAADVGADEADLLQRQTEAFRQHHARRVHALVAGNECVGIRRRIIGGDARARLHLAVDDALIDEGLLDDEIGRFECRAYRRSIAEVLVERDIVRAGDGPDRLGAGRLAYIRHGGQHVVFDFDRFGRVARGEHVFRHHHGNGFARITCTVGRQRILLLFEDRPLFRCEGPHLDVDRAGRVGSLYRPLEAVGGIVRAGQHGDHARYFSRSPAVDPLDLGVRVRRTHEHRDRLSRHRDIVGVLSCAAHEAQVLEARHSASDVGAALGSRCPIHVRWILSCGRACGSLSNGLDRFQRNRLAVRQKPL